MRFLAAFAVLMLTADVALAQSISVGPALGWLQPYVDAVMNGLIVVVFAWVGYYLKTKFNIDIDAGNRDALRAFVQRQAGSLVADGFVKVNGLEIKVPNAAVAIAANTALTHIPDAMAYFNLTPDRVQQMIVDAIPSVPSVAATSAATAVPA